MLQSTSLLAPPSSQQQPASPTPSRPHGASQYGATIDINASSSSYKSASSDNTWRPVLKPPRTPTPSTVSQNDNDDGLYLLWTHQLLKERHGATDIDADDHSSIDSSVTDGDGGGIDGDDGTTSRPWTLSYSYSSSTSVYKPSIHMSTSSYSHQLINTNLNSSATEIPGEHHRARVFSGWWEACFLCTSK